jgi:hypothetical protein
MLLVIGLHATLTIEVSRECSIPSIEKKRYNQQYPGPNYASVSQTLNARYYTSNKNTLEYSLNDNYNVSDIAQIQVRAN